MISRHASAGLVVMLALTALAAQGCTKQGAALGGAAAVGVVIAQERSVSDAVSDAVIRATINELLIRNNFKLFRDVEIEVVEGRVLLAGNVRGPRDRVEAVRLSWRAAGVKEVINEIEVRAKGGGIGNYARDSWISTQFLAKLLLDKDIRALNYNVDTVNGVVYLIGIAQSPAELVRATNHARAIPYVRKVVSHVRLKDAPAS